MSYHPCNECITFAICKNPLSHQLPETLTKLGNKCSIIYDYLTLKDLNLKRPPDDMPMSKRGYFNKPLAKRVLLTCKIMGWKDFDLTIYELFKIYLKEQRESNG